MTEVRRTVAGATEQEEECPVELTALVLCKAGAPHVIRDLAPGPKTFNELRQTIVNTGESSSRTLAARLKHLQREGYVNRTELGGYLRRVEYSLSEKGESLLPVIQEMERFGRSWLMDRSCKGLPGS